MTTSRHGALYFSVPAAFRLGVGIGAALGALGANVATAGRRHTVQRVLTFSMDSLWTRSNAWSGTRTCRTV